MGCSGVDAERGLFERRQVWLRRPKVGSLSKDGKKDERDESTATRVDEEAGVFRGKSSVRPARGPCFMPPSIPAPVTAEMMGIVTSHSPRHCTWAVPVSHTLPVIGLPGPARRALRGSNVCRLLRSLESLFYSID